ncbi:phospholipase [Microbacterium sp.]|uniref:aggregation-promoting factor C-terminal-like domain-containing protein n=1 Tax=Microbacterium sp. TaxID=51671 RepID=UPI002E341C54|nr:phospholipase [Microbacterium sp.]HEX5729994.1 phospholipase [Microbacterium sp.]
MLEPQTRRARRSARKSIAPRAAAFGVAFSAIALTGLLTAIPAAAATPAAASPAAVAQSAVQTLREISQDAQAALDAARAALTEASTVTADITASGLDVGVADTSVDTAELRDAMDRLSAFDVVPVLLLPDVTEDVTTETRRVLAGAAELRDLLQAAQAQKAADDAAAAAAAAAAAEAAAEAQRQADAAAAEAQRQAEIAAAAEAALASANTPEGAKAVAAQIASAEYGWGGDQFSCLVSLWDRESGWNYEAYNASSGATGIPQALPGSKMASAGSDWQTNAVTQIKWGLGYIEAVYGSPCGAWGHSESTGWY